MTIKFPNHNFSQNDRRALTVNFLKYLYPGGLIKAQFWTNFLKLLKL